MQKIALHLLLLGLMLSSAAPAATLTGRDRYLSPENFRLLDQFGYMHLLSSYDSKAILLVAISLHCRQTEWVKRRLSDLRETYGKSGLLVFAIDPDLHDSREEVARTFDSRNPVLIDDLQNVSRSFKLLEPGAFVLLSGDDLTVRRAGALKTDAAVLTADIESLVQMQAGAWPKLVNHVSDWTQRLPWNQRACSINFMDGKKLNFAADVLPAFNAACNKCHMLDAGTDYFKSASDILGWSAMIQWTLRMKTMPPGKVDSYYGDFVKTFGADNQRAILSWLVSAPTEPISPDPVPDSRTALMERAERRPEYLFKMSRADVIPAEGLIPYHYVQIAGPLRDDIWAEAYRVTGNRSVLHHSDLIVSPEPLSKAERYISHGMTRVKKATVLGRNRRLKIVREDFVWGPQNFKLPAGAAYLIPKGSYLILELHYQPSGQVEKNLASVEFFKYSGATPPKALQSLGLYRDDLHIPPGEKRYVVRSHFPVDKDMTVLLMDSHMHMRGLSYRATLKAPDGRESVIYSKPLHQFQHPDAARISTPLFIPRGSDIRLEAIYDNSEDNPANPDAHVLVNGGPQTLTDEMCIFRIGYFDGKI